MAVQRAEATAEAWDWLPDDSEESVVGIRLHQDNISVLAATLRAYFEEQGLPWGVGTNTAISGLTRRDGTAYAPMPDVLVQARPITLEMASIDLAEEGPPWLVIEVASPSTVRADTGEKAATYARGGIAEYLVFDPTGELVGQQMWARRLPAARRGGAVVGRYEPWEAEADGHWHSQTLGLAFGAEGLWLGVWDRHGAPIERMSEERRKRKIAERQVETERAAHLDAERRAETEHTLRLDAERRAADLEALVRRLRGDGG